MKRVLLFLVACSSSVDGTPDLAQPPQYDLAPNVDLITVAGCNAQNVTGCLLSAVWGSGTGDVYIGGTDRASHAKLFHSTGNGSWTEQPVEGGAIAAIWGSGSGDVYASSADSVTTGMILHSTGNGTWTMQSTGGASLARVWGSSAGDIYAVGLGGAILHSTGNGVWTPQTSGTTLDLLGLWGSSASDLYAVGGDIEHLGPAVILHSTGNGTWEPQTVPSSLSVQLETGTAVWGSGSNNVYAAFIDSMQTGQILRSTGNGTWTIEYSESYENAVWALWGLGSGDVYAGDDVGLLHSTGNGSWTAQNAMRDGFSDIWGNADGMYAVGIVSLLYLPAP